MGYCTNKFNGCRYCGCPDIRFSFQEYSVRCTNIRTVYEVGAYCNCCGNRTDSLHESFDEALAQWNRENPMPEMDIEKGIL